MGARDLLADLGEAGFRVSIVGDRLVVSPASKLTDDLRVALREAKSELLGHLRHLQRVSQAEELLAAQAAKRLASLPGAQRAAHMEPTTAGGYVVGVAVRTPGGEIVTAIVHVPPCDPFLLAAAFDRASIAPPH